MTQHALLMVHRASHSVERLAQLIREKGFEPTVLASRPTGKAGAVDSFEAACHKLDLRYCLTGSGEITLADTFNTLQALPGDYKFALSVWDGHRMVMTQVNERLGACDVSPADMARVQDKLAARHALAQAGLTSIRAYSVSDPVLPAAMNGQARFIARPRRGIGSLLTAVVTRFDEAQALNRELQQRPAEGDLFSAFFHGNEIFVEDFFEGREFSLDLIRSHGQTVSACWHEKTAMRVADLSIHECAFASPPVSVSADDLANGLTCAERVMAALGMAHGSFHVELMHGTRGRWELIEVNARPGGILVSESVYQQFGVRPSADWVDVLAGRQPAPHGEPSCGTYQQVAYPEPGRAIAALQRRPGVRQPDVEINTLPVGGVAQAGREDYAYAGLWRTPRVEHAAEVGRLAAADYIEFEYAPESHRLGARTLERIFLVLEPNNHVYKVIEEAARRGLHVVVLHSTLLRAEGSYRAGLDAIAERHEIATWDDDDAVFGWVEARIGKGHGSSILAGTYTAYETVLPLEARIRQHYGLPTESPDRYRQLLRKPMVRQMLRDAGLSRLRCFDPREVLRTGEWPLGDRAAFLKPVCGLGSFHVTRCTGVDDVRAGLEVWDRRALACRPVLQLHLDRGGDLFLEEEGPGELMSVEGLVTQGRYHALGITSRTVLADNVAVEMGASFPYAHPLAERIVAKVRAIHEGLVLRHGMTHAEVVCGPDGEVELVELNLRFAGSDVLLLMDMTLPRSTTGVLVDMACGLVPSQPADAATQNGPGPQSAVGVRCASLQQLLPPQAAASFDSWVVDDPAVVELRNLKPLGTALKSHCYQSDQVASFIVLAEDYCGAVEAAARVRRTATINGATIADEPNNRVLLR